jgi:hypothetical protein
MKNEYFNYFVMFFFVVVIIAMISKVLRIQFSLFDVNIKEGLVSSDKKSTTSSTSSCVDTTKNVSEITDKIKKMAVSISSKIKSTDRTEMENLITSYHDLLNVWAIHDLMVTDTSNNECISKTMLKLSMYGNAGKCLETSLQWLDEQT